MTTENNAQPENTIERSGEAELRGAALEGSDQKDSLYHSPTDPDISVYVDGEQDTLYDDGLEIGDDSDTLLGTDGNPLP